MTLSKRDEYVKYRIEKSEETFEVAELLVQNLKWNSAINRLYYSVFYAVSGLLVKLEIPTKTHTGVKTQFFLHFIKTRKLELNYGELYSDLFDWRHKGDYGDFFDFTKDDVQPLLKPTKEFIKRVKFEIEKITGDD